MRIVFWQSVLSVVTFYYLFFLLRYIHVVCDQDVDVGGILLLRAYHVCEPLCSQCLYGHYVRCTRSCLVAIFYISIDSQQYFYMLNALPNAP